MAQSVFTSSFQVKNAERLYTTIGTDTSEHYYVFAAKSTPWTNDSSPDAVNTSISSIFYDTHDQMLFGKKIGANNICMMVANNPWTSGTVYDVADSSVDLTTKTYFVVTQDSGQYSVWKCLSNNGGVPSIQQPLWSDISIDPTTETYYTVADGYHWKYMYSIPVTTYNTFATSAFIPCLPNANVANAAVSGSINQIDTTYPGSLYNNWNTGQFTIIAYDGNNYVYGISPVANSTAQFYSNSDIYITSGPGAGQLMQIVNSYSVGTSGTFTIPVVNTSTNTVSNVTITTTGFNLIVLNSPFTTVPTTDSEYYIAPRVYVDGDGTNCIARSLIDISANSISRVEVVDIGSNYSYANVSVMGAVVSNGVANSATCVAAISPPGGHGANAHLELNASYVGVAITMGNNEPYPLPSNGDYRRIGVVGNPLLANVSISVSNVVSSCSGISNTYVIGSTVTGLTSNSSGIVNYVNGSQVLLTMVNGYFQSNEELYQANVMVSSSNVSVTGTITNVNENLTFDNRTKLNIGTINISNSSFVVGETVNQNDTGAFGVIYSIDSANTILSLTEVKGTFNPGYEVAGTTSGASSNVISIVAPDFVKYTGDVIHVENILPITRSPTQTETLKIVLGYN